jgi:pyruvate formate lyase activating enzyme
VAGIQVDPIEKKPFFHVAPGSDALSFGMLGCDFHCAYCQNWFTSQSLRDPAASARPEAIAPSDLCEIARAHGARVMTSTYNEPLITSEWAVAVFKEARARGLKTSYVSNGNATEEVLEYLRPHVDYYKIDLKGFRDQAYRQLGGQLSTVCDTIRRAHRMGFWVEIVTLVVPGFNDSIDEIRDLTEFIASVSPDIPWHATAFHPDYKMQAPARTTALRLLEIGEAGKRAGLNFVYLGNLPGRVGGWENTYCPHCRAELVARQGFRILRNRMTGSLCPDCQRPVPGRWAL